MSEQITTDRPPSVPQWSAEQLATTQAVSAGITEYFSEPTALHGLPQIDDLFPVAAGATPASKQYEELSPAHYSFRQAGSDEKLIAVFACISGSITPNDLPYRASVAKTARFMRAIQSGVDNRFKNDKTGRYRDDSEAHVARLLHASRKYLEEEQLQAFDEARKSADLLYTPGRRVLNAFRFAGSLASR